MLSGGRTFLEGHASREQPLATIKILMREADVVCVVVRAVKFVIMLKSCFVCLSKKKVASFYHRVYL